MNNFFTLPHKLPFQDRHEAGNLLTQKLAIFKNETALVLGLARGGVEVAYEVARFLKLQLTVLVVRKIGAPQNPEFAIGAVAENEVALIDETTVTELGISTAELEKLKQSEFAEVVRRVFLYRGGKPLPGLKGKSVILVDDGVATGWTARAAIEVAKKLQAAKVFFAAPVCAQATTLTLKAVVDELVILEIPVDLGAIGAFYEDFHQTTDETVIELLKRNRQSFAKT